MVVQAVNGLAAPLRLDSRAIMKALRVKKTISDPDEVIQLVQRNGKKEEETNREENLLPWSK